MMDYLNNYLNDHAESTLDNFIIIQGNEEDDYDSDIVIEHDSEDGRLYVDHEFLKTFSNLFPLDMEDSLEFIKDWFEWKFGVDVNYTQS